MVILGAIPCLLAIRAPGRLGIRAGDFPSRVGAAAAGPSVEIRSDGRRRPLDGLHVDHSMRGAILFRSSARQTKFHSARAFVSPRIEKVRKFITDLIHPNGGSTMHFRLL